MAERFYAKTVSEKKYGPAAQILALLMKASGAFAQESPERDRLVAELGPPPTEPTAMLVWAQRAMAYGLYDVLTNPALVPERKLRWIAELGSKLGMTHSKSLVEAKLSLIEAHAGLDQPGAPQPPTVPQPQPAAPSAAPTSPSEADGPLDSGPPRSP